MIDGDDVESYSKANLYRTASFGFGFPEDDVMFFDVMPMMAMAEAAPMAMNVRGGAPEMEKVQRAAPPPMAAQADIKFKGATPSSAPTPSKNVQETSPEY